MSERRSNQKTFFYNPKEASSQKPLVKDQQAYRLVFDREGVGMFMRSFKRKIKLHTSCHVRRPLFYGRSLNPIAKIW